MIGGLYYACCYGSYSSFGAWAPRPKYKPPVAEDAGPSLALHPTVIGPGMCERVVRWLQLSQRCR